MLKKWLPTRVDVIYNSFNFKCENVLKSNLAYNIQYLQFLVKNIDFVDTTTVLYKMRYKTFIITSMAIIETIFIILLEENNLIPLDEWTESKHKHRNIDDNTIEVSFTRKKKIKPTIKKINFDEAIYLIESNNVLEISNRAYPIIRNLQKLRNKIHLNKAKDYCDSDYNSFNEYTYRLTKKVFYHIMCNEKISKNINYLSFLQTA